MTVWTNISLSKRTSDTIETHPLILVLFKNEVFSQYYRLGLA